jgi:hypothetical protein
MTASSIWRCSGSLQIKNIAGAYSAAMVAQKETAAVEESAAAASTTP